jgi:hypothetical protein
MPTCAPAALSHRIDCGAPWRPITAARLHLLLATLPPVKFRPHPVPRCSMQASVSYHRIPSPVASPVNRWQAALPPRRHVALLRWSTAVKAVAPPRCRRQAPGDKASRSASTSSFLANTTCSHLASNSVAPCRVGTVRWHAHARHVALSSAIPPVQHT